MTHLRSGAPGAELLFRAVLKAHDVRAAWIGLAAALLQSGDVAGAAESLQPALSRHAGPLDASLIALADDVVRAHNAAGWCALQTGAVLKASVPRPTLRLDGKLARLDPGMGLPPAWRQASQLDVTYRGRVLLGSPIALNRMRATEGAVDWESGSIMGWVWHPADPETAPTLNIGRRRLTPTETSETVPHGLAPLARPRVFHLPLRSSTQGPLHIRGPDGRDLLGSPIYPQRAPAPPAKRPPKVLRLRAPKVTVIVPVYGSPARTLACLESLRRELPPWAQILVVDDASPQPELATALDQLAAERQICLLRCPANLGFPSAVNAGLALAVGDVVLLNSDTLVPLGWLEQLHKAAWSDAAIGTVTPLSNDATITSYPSVEGGNTVPNLAETDQLHRLAARANGARVVTIPTAVGFCMYIRRDCLRAVGPLRADVFAQGYGEENDFCMRAHAAGWRHVAAVGAFVAHVGSASFGGARAHLLARNEKILHRLHPIYPDLVARHIAADPLALARRRIDRARWPNRPEPAVLLITHDMGGGVQRQVEARIDALAGEGFRPVLLRPVLNHPGWCRIDDGRDRSFPNLRFRLPKEQAALRSFLTVLSPVRMEVHHLLGHAPGLFALCRELRRPYEIYVHDYAWFCQRITLIGPDRRYCGEPGPAGCVTCIATAGRHIDEQITPVELLRRSGQELAGATRVIAPSADTAARMRRHFPRLSVTIEPWESAKLPVCPPPQRQRAGRRVCVVGAIGVEKGFDILLACAEDAAHRRLPLDFVVVGYTIDDAKLHATGRVFVTGPYEADDVPGLIIQQTADIAFLPSLWPETWCFALSEMWRADLDVVAFDIGAPAERIRASGRGRLLPLGLSPAAINDVLQAG